MTHRKSCLLVAAIGLMVYGQKPERLEFEVASIKLAKPGGRGGGIRPLAGGQTYVAENVPVKLIFRLMSRLTPQQVTGGPGWLDDERYDITAKAARPSNIDDLHTMFLNLLADQFKLQFHTEKKELPVYALSVDKAGVKMKLNETEQDFKIPITPTGFGNITGVRVDMKYMCFFLSQTPGMDRPVIDKTGLDKVYDFTLHWTPDLPGISKENLPPGADLDGPSIFDALKQQLGLKLEAQKGPVEIYVIDRAERPATN